MFNIFQVSTQDGRPVSCYKFSWGATQWRYTNANRAINFGDGDYQPVAISDNGVTQGSSPAEFEVTLPSNLPLVGLFRGTPPAESIWLTVYRTHYDDPDNQAVADFVGTVGNIKRVGLASAKAIGLPISATLRRTGLRLCWERACPHMLYDQDCKADKNSFKVAAEITGLTGTTITVDTLGAYTGDQFEAGFIEWEATAEGTIERRGIEVYEGGLTFTLFGLTDRLEVGTEINMFLGCDLRAETCDGTFNNLANNGAYPFMPSKSPFDGNPVF
jgi:uncharacterized phage protein (TIGR02218 family)